MIFSKAENGRVAGFAASKVVPLRRFFLATLTLTVCFEKPLFDLTCFAARSDLYSYILLIPFVSVYLVWARRRDIVWHFEPAFSWGALTFLAGFALLGGYLWGVSTDSLTNKEDALGMIVLSFICLFAGCCFFILGKNAVCSLAFPLWFLIFMVPFPTVIRDHLESFLQHTSAATANLLFTLSDTTALQNELQFRLPGIAIEVAPECSGIHSSWVLLITSLLASVLFLKTNWKRSLLVLIVIPLAILRNGFRIFVIGELCIHFGPKMIDSPIHRRGGPLFFLLSLIPLFLILYLLMKSERRSRRVP